MLMRFRLRYAAAVVAICLCSADPYGLVVVRSADLEIRARTLARSDVRGTFFDQDVSGDVLGLRWTHAGGEGRAVPGAVFSIEREMEQLARGMARLRGHWPESVARDVRLPWVHGSALVHVDRNVTVLWVLQGHGGFAEARIGAGQVLRWSAEHGCLRRRPAPRASWLLGLAGWPLGVMGIRTPEGDLDASALLMQAVSRGDLCSLRAGRPKPWPKDLELRRLGALAVLGEAPSARAYAPFEEDHLAVMRALDGDPSLSMFLLASGSPNLMRMTSKWSSDALSASAFADRAREVRALWSELRVDWPMQHEVLRDLRTAIDFELQLAPHPSDQKPRLLAALFRCAHDDQAAVGFRAHGQLAAAGWEEQRITDRATAWPRPPPRRQAIRAVARLAALEARLRDLDVGFAAALRGGGAVALTPFQGSLPPLGVGIATFEALEARAAAGDSASQGALALLVGLEAGASRVAIQRAAAVLRSTFIARGAGWLTP